MKLNSHEKKIVKILSKGMMSLDELTKIAELPANILNSCLTTLEISGLIN